MIEIQRTPMKDGGWVATHVDITEKRRADALLAESTAEVKRTNERFDVAISNMAQGLCLFDADKRLVISNRRYQEMYRLPDELVLPGTPLDRILQHYVDRGETSDLTVDQHVQLMPTQPKQSFISRPTAARYSFSASRCRTAAGSRPMKMSPSRNAASSCWRRMPPNSRR